MLEPRGNKLAKIKSAISKGVELYINENRERLGDLHVFDVLVFEDCRSAKVFLRCQKSFKIGPRDINRAQVSEQVKKFFSSKYLPSLQFIFIDDQDNLF
ncbi:MAG: hypothetical protein BWY43_00724 [candidate division WS2 bacterium ADurb.Bin280]|uniref:Ribosome-binding factor A n=1 Tax=candidate division WS2 bacterium ADurb.Bin280 TaxID=1852829 RepID=A0A1V5SBU1_9BACT|nr:MAG: hypothetical protein BWY43_00724 [candidate division WS2 bacterium ADurb.Bin280]